MIIIIVQYKASYKKLNASDARNNMKANNSVYNCGGFAFGTYDWFFVDFESLYEKIMYKNEKKAIPTLNTVRRKIVRKGFDGIEKLSFRKANLRETESLEEAIVLVQTLKSTRQIMSKFGTENIRIIGEVDELLDDEFAVAFRLSDGFEGDYELDFHFMKRNHAGVWFQKCGSSSIRRYNGNPLTDDWDCSIDYNGPVVLFALKNKYY